MLKTAAANWALLLGIGVLMLGHGLQGTLLGVRANIEGFAPVVIGVIMAGYSLGYLLAAIRVQRLIARVGHVRVFAAVAAIASTAILLHAVIVNPIAWFALRFVTGYSIAGIYIVAESWLNGSSSNENRGGLLSVYMIVQSGGIAVGQFLLNLDDPATTDLFIVASVLLSIAIVPMLLSSVPAPIVASARELSLRDLYRVSPLGFVGMFGVGMAQATLLGLGAVFAASLGFSLAAVSTFMAMIFAGGMVLQWPIGRLSDLLDRRKVILGASLVAAATLATAYLAVEAGALVLTGLFFLYGGLCMPLYALCLAHTNDYLDNDQRVAASGTLSFVAGLGMIVGPLAASGAMQVVGPVGFVAFLFVIHAATSVFAVYRMTRRAMVPLDQQGDYVYVSGSTGVSPVMSSWAQEASMDAAATETAAQQPADDARVPV